MKTAKKYGLIAVFIIFAFLSVLLRYPAGEQISLNFWKYFIEMITIVPFIFIIVGLLDVWVPKKIIEKHIGKDSGLGGVFFAILFAFIQAGPLYTAFPVTYLLYKKGASARNIFIYLGAFSTIKLPMIGMELNYLGPKFTIVHSLLSLPLFILGGYIMEYYLRNSEFKITQPGNPE